MILIAIIYERKRQKKPLNANRNEINERNTNEKKTVFGPYIVDIDIHATRTHTHNQIIHYAKNQRYLDTHTHTRTQSQKRSDIRYMRVPLLVT